jgi:hypothetical protein
MFKNANIDTSDVLSGLSFYSQHVCANISSLIDVIVNSNNINEIRVLFTTEHMVLVSYT